MSEVTFGDVLFIVGVFGIIYACLQLARRSDTSVRERKDRTPSDDG